MIKYRVIPFVFNRLKFATELNYQINFRKLTIAEIAASAGISPAAIKDLQSGKNSNYEFKTFLGVCNALDLDPHEYFALEE